MRDVPSSLYLSGGKRVLDFVGSLSLLILTIPIQALCAAAVVADSGRPVFFSQSRVGKDGKIFKLHKFRTMNAGTERTSGNYPTHEMITKVGRLLRRTSLDEIPQLANILLGEMSFVGPRPTLAPQVARYTEEQRGRLAVRPGLTGLAQVRHRNNAPWSRRIESDLEYIGQQSPSHDLRIVLRTIPAALRGDGQVVGQTAQDVDDLSAPDSAPGSFRG